MTDVNEKITEVTIVKKSEEKPEKYEKPILLDDDNDLSIELDDGTEFDLSHICNRLTPQDIRLILHYSFGNGEGDGKNQIKLRKKLH